MKYHEIAMRVLNRPRIFLLDSVGTEDRNQTGAFRNLEQLQNRANKAP